MRRWHWAALTICVVATTVVVLQSRAIRATPVSNAAQPAGEPVEAAAPAPPVAAERTEQTRELARLRNEVMQLRAQKTGLELARRENARLVEAQKTNTGVIKRETPPGFVSRDKLSNVGYATPDDAVQTFFWAMRDGDFSALVTSFSPTSKERQRFDQMSAEQREKMQAKLKGPTRAELIDQLSDIGVRSREILSEDSMTLHVGSSLSTNTVPMRVDRTAEGWKLRDPGF